jgi:hypothetical protein
MKKKSARVATKKSATKKKAASKANPPETHDQMLARLRIGPDFCGTCARDYNCGLRVLCHQCWVETPEGAHRKPTLKNDEMSQHQISGKMSKKPLTSHQLAELLLALPNLPVSCHEHGELLVAAAEARVAANVGLLQCIALQFE